LVISEGSKVIAGQGYDLILAQKKGAGVIVNGGEQIPAAIDSRKVAETVIERFAKSLQRIE